jgi:hypothetical protein
LGGGFSPTGSFSPRGFSCSEVFPGGVALEPAGGVSGETIGALGAGLDTVTLACEEEQLFFEWVSL